MNEKEKEIDVWQYIATALEHWTQRILDTGSRHTTSGNFRQTIEESLRRQQLDGFLTVRDITELRYITDLWVNLLNAISCYTVGCVFVKRDIISYLLELHSLRQITSCLFIGKFCCDILRGNGHQQQLCMNLLVITNVCSHRLIYNSLHEIHSIVHSKDM